MLTTKSNDMRQLWPTIQDKKTRQLTLLKHFCPSIFYPPDWYSYEALWLPLLQVHCKATIDPSSPVGVALHRSYTDALHCLHPLYILGDY